MRTRFLALTLCLLAAVSPTGCGGRETPRDPPAAPRESQPLSPRAGIPVQVEMRNVDFHVDESVVLRIRRLSGALVSTRPGAPPIFDDKTSFVLRIRSGEIAIDEAGLTDLMNRYAFAAADAPLKDISIRIEGDEVRQKARLRKTGLPVEIVGKLDATPEGAIRLRPRSIRMAGLPVKGLMALFKLKLGKVIDLTKARGAEAEGNDLLLFPDRILPPPRMEGKISSVRVEGGRIVQVFGKAGPASDADRSANFMHYRGGTLRFGKLTMHDSDLEIVDASPSDPFDFFLDHYKEQLVAGYSKTTPTFGLQVFMPDYHRLRARTGS